MKNNDDQLQITVVVVVVFSGKCTCWRIR